MGIGWYNLPSFCFVRLKTAKNGEYRDLAFWVGYFLFLVADGMFWCLFMEI